MWSPLEVSQHMLRVVHAYDQPWFHGRADPFPNVVSVSARLTGFVACRMGCVRSSTRNTSATSRLVLGLGWTLTLQLNLSHIKETDNQVPDRIGNFFYYTRTVKGSPYGVGVCGVYLPVMQSYPLEKESHSRPCAYCCQRSFVASKSPPTQIGISHRRMLSRRCARMCMCVRACTQLS